MNSTRRQVVAGGLAGAASIGLGRLADAAEPPPETRRIRLPRFVVDVACVSPMWVADALLHGEGFEEVQYVETTFANQLPALIEGNIDFQIRSPFAPLLALDAGRPLMLLAGIHSGCFELFGTNGVRSVRDLRGRRIGVADAGRRAFVAMMLQQVGLDAQNGVTFVDTSASDGVGLLAAGRIDAYLGFSPEPEQIHAQRIAGVSLVDTAIDRPWSQYFCCSVVGNREFVGRHPVATKRALRAFVKAADICAANPAETARALVERGLLKDAAAATETLRRIPYRRWRDYDSADTQRFYALRMHEVGALKSDPNKLLAQGTDWHFIEQIKRELKA